MNVNNDIRPIEPVEAPAEALTAPTSQPQPAAPQVVSTLQSRPISAQEIDNKHRKSDIKNTVASVLILLMAPVIALFLTLFVFQSYQVDGPSMETTLHNADRLIVWKLPRSIARITHQQYVPNRGDVIIFSEPGLGNYNEPDGSKQLVKRVIGLPGDRVVLADGTYTVYNSAHPDGFKPDKTLPYGSEGHIPTTEPSSDKTEWVLAANQLFVSGDNRPNSLDSRSFGPINTNQVVGKLVARILPLSQAEIF